MEALVIEPVDLGDRPGFMIASEKRNPIGIPHFERQKKTNTLDGVVASINVVPEKEVVDIWRNPCDFEEFHEIVKLSVNVPANCERRIELNDGGLV